MAFRSEYRDQKKILDTTFQLLIDCDWLRRIVGDGDDTKDYLAPGAMWVQHAQHLGEPLATTIAILNAWALALGFRLNPSFSPYRDPTRDDH